jgi:hypothetical protein
MAYMKTWDDMSVNSFHAYPGKLCPENAKKGKNVA